MNKAFTKTTLAAALAVAALSGGAAQAATKGYAQLLIEDFQFRQGAGGALIDPGTQLIIAGSSNNNGGVTAEFPGSPGATNNVTVDITTPVDLFACQGPDCTNGPSNDFSIPASNPGGTAGDLSEADNQLIGSAFTAAGADARLDSLTSMEAVAGTAAASASDDLGLNLTFTITDGALAAAGFNISFDASAYLEAYVTADAFGTTFSDASIGWNIQIVEANDITGTPVFEWSPDGQANGVIGGTEEADSFTLNTNRSRSAADLPQTTSFFGAALGTARNGSFSATATGLSTGVQYILTINHTSDTNSRLELAQVPAPASLALLGLGLVGLGVARRRAK